MSVKLKERIRIRQHAFHANKCGLAYKFYRNAVNRERNLCRTKYYASKVKDLKEASKPTSMVEQSAQTQWVRETKIKFTIISKCTRV